MRIVTADVGGTNARFAFAEIDAGKRPRLHDVRHYPVAGHDGLASAWRAFGAECGGALPRNAAIAVATPFDGHLLRFTNSAWVIDRRSIAAELGLDHLVLLNDFGAVAHAVASLGPDELEHVAGPEGPLPGEGVTTVIGPGTGLGVAMFLRRGGESHVIETEAAHIAFAPLDAEEMRIERQVTERYGRCSIERIVSGPGLNEIHRALGGSPHQDEIALWTSALAGEPEAGHALERLVKAFGSTAGDLALAQGANSVVISGGLARRMADQLRSPAFRDRFVAKGRYRQRMEAIPVRLVTADEPGLLGAALAFAEQVGEAAASSL